MKVGGEVTVNNVTQYEQAMPRLARLANGGMIAIWESSSSALDSSRGIMGRLLRADGTPIGPEFLINTATNGMQHWASTTGLAGGGFVVTWATQDAAQDGSQSAVKAQQFDAAGAKVGGEIVVNSTASAGDIAVARLANGGFVVT